MSRTITFSNSAKTKRNEIVAFVFPFFLFFFGFIVIVFCIIALLSLFWHYEKFKIECRGKTGNTQKQNKHKPEIKTVFFLTNVHVFLHNPCHVWISFCELKEDSSVAVTVACIFLCQKKKNKKNQLRISVTALNIRCGKNKHRCGKNKQHKFTNNELRLGFTPSHN